MTTVSSIRQSFAGHIGIIQDDALARWRLALPDSGVVVCGDEEGGRAAAERVGVTFVADMLPWRAMLGRVSHPWRGIPPLSRHAVAALPGALGLSA